jgi:hypothetical protein
MTESFILFFILICLIGGLADGVCKILGLSVSDAVESSKNIFTFLFTDRY